MKDVLHDDLEKAEGWEWLYRKEAYETEELDQQTEEGLAGAITHRVIVERSIQVVEQLIRHHLRYGRTPLPWEEVDYSDRQAAARGRRPRTTKEEITDAIRAVIERGDYPKSKLHFYKEVDRERGLTGEGRASERWLRENHPGGVPEPDDWKGLL
jgi:hypothetical protein